MLQTAHSSHAALDALLRPRSIVVIGASSMPASRGYHVWRSVALSTGLNALWPVNPKYRFVGEHRCYPNAYAIPDSEIDLAILCVKSKHLPNALKSLEKNPPKAVLFAPQQEGPLIELSTVEQLYESVKRMGSRLLGPNSIGTMAPVQGINASFWPRTPRPGGVALIAQSAMIATGFIERAAASGLGFSGVVSTGLEIDVGLAELIDWFAQDRSTRVIAVEVEALRCPRAFHAALRRATDLKPVVVLRAGPGSGYAADRLAANRFGTDAGADDAFDALLENAGAQRVRTFKHFFAATAAFASGTLPAGRRIAVIANGCGFAGLAADAAEAAGIHLEGLANRTIHFLAKIHPEERLPVNPVVVGAGASGGRLAETLSIVLEDAGIDGAAVVVGPSPMSQLDPTLSELARAAVKTYKPVFISWISSTADAAVRRQLDQLPNSRLIAVRSPDEAMFAFGCLASRSASLNARRSPPKPRKNKLSAEALACIRLIFHRVREGGRHTLLPRELHELMRHLGLRPVDGRITHSLEEAQQAARELGWPVAIKASSTALGSRSASGLVFLNLDSAEALADAWKELTTNWAENSPWSQPDGVLVESMSQHAFERELRLGIRLDPVLGPVVEFGGAGLASTLYNDLSVALAPLSQDEAESLAHAPRYAQTLDAYRGLPPINWDELTDALGRLGDLAAALPALRSLRLEPVVPTDNGLLVIDASVALYDAPLIPRRDYPHLVLRPAPIEDQTEARARSGEPLILRALTENDFDAFRTFVMTLSDKSYFYRFHTATRPSTARLAALCRPSWIESGVWGLFAETGALVASGRWSAVQNGGNTDKEAEFGIAVLDSWQRQGLARILMNKLETEAFAEGFHTMVGLVLPGNEAMEHAMTALGYMLDNASAGDSREARRWIRRLQPS